MQKPSKYIDERSDSLPLTFPGWMIHSQFLVNEISVGGVEGIQ